jgi:hypothetical protein
VTNLAAWVIFRRRRTSPRCPLARFSPQIAACKSLASAGKVIAFGRTNGVDRDPLKVALAQRAEPMRHPQALGQQQFQPVAEPLAPMAQVRTLVRERVPEEPFASKILEIGVVDPALAHPLIGQPVNVLEQQQPDREAGLDAWPAVLAVERRDLPSIQSQSSLPAS